MAPDSENKSMQNLTTVIIAICIIGGVVYSSISRVPEEIVYANQDVMDNLSVVLLDAEKSVHMAAKGKHPDVVATYMNGLQEVSMATKTTFAMHLSAKYNVPTSIMNNNTWLSLSDCTDDTLATISKSDTANAAAIGLVVIECLT